MNYESKNIHQRILQIANEIPYVAHEDKTVNGQYTFVSHDAVNDAVRSLLVKYGVNIIHDVIDYRRTGNLTEVQVNNRVINADSPNDSYCFSTWGTGIDSQDKGFGKAMSYACKYAMLKLFKVRTGDDPERSLVNYRPDSKDGPVQSKPKVSAVAATPKQKGAHETVIEMLKTLDVPARDDALWKLSDTFGLSEKMTSDLIKALDPEDAVMAMVELQDHLGGLV